MDRYVRLCRGENLLLAGFEKRAQRFIDVVAPVHAAGDDFLSAGSRAAALSTEALAQNVDEASRAVRTGHLAVAEHVRPGEQALLDDLRANAIVALGGVVAVGKVEEIGVPVAGVVVLVEHLQALLVG